MHSVEIKNNIFRKFGIIYDSSNRFSYFEMNWRGTPARCLWSKDFPKNERIFVKAHIIYIRQRKPF